jgi:hypothetical protein
VTIVDRQAIRTAEGGEDRGYDAGKKITGRKRHLAGCGKSLPPQDAAIGDPQKPRLFGVSPK